MKKGLWNTTQGLTQPQQSWPGSIRCSRLVAFLSLPSSQLTPALSSATSPGSVFSGQQLCLLLPPSY